MEIALIDQLRRNNLVTVDNPVYHPKLKDVPLSIRTISQAWISENKEWSYGISIDSLIDTENITSPLYAQYIEYIKPIKPTSAWLGIKLGFEYSPTLKVWYLPELSDWEIQLSKDGCFYLLHEALASRRFNKELKYVHEVQNIFLDLFDIQLKIRLDHMVYLK
jgi:hypothetical protein